MNRFPIISIITPVYNSFTTIEQCLRSVQIQTYVNIEHIVIDGLSKDGTLDLIKKFDSSRMSYISEKDNGIYDAMNKGLNLAKGDFIYFLGADDQLHTKNTIHDVFYSLKNLETDLIFGNILYTDGKKFTSTFNNSLLIRNTLHHQAAFYASQLFQNYRFDTSRKVLADYEMNLILYKKKIRSIYVNQIVAQCGNMGISKTYKWSTYYEEYLIKKSIFDGILRLIAVFPIPFKFICKKMKKIIYKN